MSWGKFSITIFTIAASYRTAENCRTFDLPPEEDGNTTSHTQTVPSEEEVANIASLWETMNPVMHVMPFLCDCGSCKTCLHCKKKKDQK